MKESFIIELTNAERLRMLRHVKSDERAVQNNPKATAKQFQAVLDLKDKLEIVYGRAGCAT